VSRSLPVENVRLAVTAKRALLCTKAVIGVLMLIETAVRDRLAAVPAMEIWLHANTLTTVFPSEGRKGSSMLPEEAAVKAATVTRALFCAKIARGVLMLIETAVRGQLAAALAMETWLPANASTTVFPAEGREVISMLPEGAVGIVLLKAVTVTRALVSAKAAIGFLMLIETAVRGQLTA